MIDREEGEQIIQCVGVVVVQFMEVLKFCDEYIICEVVVVEVETFSDSKASVSKFLISMIRVFKRLSCKLNICSVKYLICCSMVSSCRILM